MSKKHRPLKKLSLPTPLHTINLSKSHTLVEQLHECWALAKDAKTRAQSRAVIARGHDYLCGFYAGSQTSSETNRVDGPHARDILNALYRWYRTCCSTLKMDVNEGKLLVALQFAQSASKLADVSAKLHAFADQHENNDVWTCVLDGLFDHPRVFVHVVNQLPRVNPFHVASQLADFGESCIETKLYGTIVKTKDGFNVIENMNEYLIFFKDFIWADAGTYQIEEGFVTRELAPASLYEELHADPDCWRDTLNLARVVFVR